jgi:hypothetical protein
VLEAEHAFIEIPSLPTRDRRLRHARPPHDRNGPYAISGHQNDFRLPRQLTRCNTGYAQSLKLSAVGRAKVKADAGAYHPPFMQQGRSFGNPMSGREY